MLKVEHVSGGYTGESVLKDISFEVNKGDLFGILGPNGSGKTTLLKMISGILPIQQGEIVLNEKRLQEYKAKQLAQMVAVLSQHSSHSFSYTVKETVSLGRYAHQKGWFQTWGKEDENIVQTVMDQIGVSSLQNKNIQELSGGEKQRVFLAQALAQEPEILLLDEPTNHLDLSYQKELLDRLRKWTTEKALTVIAIFHDLNLAGLYCDRLLLLEKGIINIEHTPNEVLKEQRIRDVYHTDIQKHPHPKIAAPQMVLVPEKQRDAKTIVIDETMLCISNEMITLSAPGPLRTMSSGVLGSGTGWHHTFVNRHVGKSDDYFDQRKEMCLFLKSKGLEPSETVAMITEADPEDAAFKLYEKENVSIFVVVAADVRNTLDASKNKMHSYEMLRGAVNTWIFVNGELTEEAFIQSMITATEAKVKAMQDLKVLDEVTGTMAARTPADGLLIAAAQRGKVLECAGSASPLGKLISKAVYLCTFESIQNSRKRKQMGGAR